MHDSSSARHVRAVFDDHTITVYQAYTPEIAGPAIAAATFVTPFKRNRMTWIKPSFLWMMYRSGWATKPDQERILAIQITREGFEWALAHATLSHYDPCIHTSQQHWATQQHASPVRVQWDPDRDLNLAPLPRRAIQIGLSSDAVDLYLDEWITTITDITPLARRIHHHVHSGNEAAALNKLPSERAYPLPPAIGQAIGVVRSQPSSDTS